jgi:hypothetical protein
MVIIPYGLDGRDWILSQPHTFTYKLSDSHVDSNLATVTLTVTPVNDAPTALALALATAEDTPLLLDLLAEARDVEGSAHGVLTVNADGAYTPGAGFNGE